MFWAATDQPQRLVLMFNVGFAHEPLAAMGLSHLVEHLALAGLAHQDYPYNGEVGERETTFYAEGTAEQLVEFAARVTRALSSLPLERIEAERRVLQTEEMVRPTESWASHMSLRFGAARHGQVDYPQYGLRWLSAGEVSAWAADHFTARNAVAMLTGPPPDNLRFHLPRGERRPPLAGRPLEMASPCYYEHSVRGVGVTMLSRTSAAQRSATRIMARRVHERLRLDLGIAYSPNCNLRPIDVETGQLFLYSDSLPVHANAVTEDILTLLRELRDSGPTDVELEHDWLGFQNYRRNLGWVLATLNRYGRTELDGGVAEPDEEYARRFREVTTEEVIEATREAWVSALVLVPLGSDGSVRELEPYRLWSASSIEGVALKRRLRLPNASPAGASLAVSDEGTTLLIRPGNPVTVRFDSTAVVLWWRDGTRVLLGEDGFTFRFRPAEWYGAEQFLDRLRERVPPDRMVPMDAGAEDSDQPGSGCEVCEGRPTIGVTLFRWTGRARSTALRVRLCRDCGRSLGRQWMARYLAASARIYPLWQTPAPMLRNAIELWRLGRLAAPRRDAGLDYWQPGESMWRRPGPYVLLLMLEVVAAVAGLVVALATGWRPPL